MNNTEILKYYGLDWNEELQALAFENEEDWLELRKKGIGGSDIGAIMGINKYSSPLQVYKTKVEGVYKDLSDKPAVKKGKDLESLIRSVYVTPIMQEKRLKVKSFSHILINNDFPWLRANLDGIGVAENPSDSVVIEIKYVTQFARVNWDNPEYNGVPASYYAQVQEYMLVTGLRKAYICALFEDKWEFKMYEIPRNETFITELIDKSYKFYNYHIIMKIPPAVDPLIDKAEIIEVLEKNEILDTPTYKDENMDTIIFDCNDLSSRIKQLEKEKADKVKELTNMYLKGARPNSKLAKFKVIKGTRTTFDSDRFKEEHPDQYLEYVKQTDYTSTSFR